MQHISRKSLGRSVFVALSSLTLFALVGCTGSSSEAESSEQTPATVAETTSTAAAADDHDHDEADADVVRLDQARQLLVVAAHDQPVLDLIDLTDGSTVSIELDAPAALSSAMTESGRFVLVGHDDGVAVVDTGVWSVLHGDHFDHYMSTPKMLGRVDGPMPTHLMSHDGLNAFHFDGTGNALVVTEEMLVDGQVSVTAEVPTSAPHHGFAVPTHGAYFVTVPTEDMEILLNVVGISDADGVVQAQFDCPLAHGEASVAHSVAAACIDGIAVVTHDDGSWSGTYLSYPQIDDEDPYGFGPARAWILAASEQGLLAAPHGARHLVVADPGNDSIRSFDLERSIATLGVTFSDDGDVLVLTQDGFLHLVDPEDGLVAASLQVISPFAEGDPDEPFRQLAVTGGRVFVTEPASNQVIEVAVGDTLVVERTIDIGFAPGFLAVANG
ncbi:hypothetical protein [Candidatus Poriferisodalis sp.]|uniref:hypothetical protein n=1 Tax=Candidatus Poriferisodalis sp. TaxID=3101277 RepID=UPI003B0110C2